MTMTSTRQTDSKVRVGVGIYHMVKTIIDLIGASAGNRWQIGIILVEV